ncbi:unnamed protein product [Symbiodinium sp. CCMP2592]|nr:unnamed protein product [Symbiodinium sp. CCMP2592]
MGQLHSRLSPLSEAWLVVLKASNRKTCDGGGDQNEHCLELECRRQVILRRTVQQGRQCRQLNAATSLLRLACDAVLELDEDWLADLCLTEHCPELAAILLRDRPGSSLAGVAFTDFVATKEEAARAEQALNKGNFEDLSANAFSTRLVDTNSSKFCTELLQVKYCKMGDAVHHLIGLREITDQESLARPRELDATFHGDADDSSVSCPYRLLNSAEASPVGLPQEGSRCMSVKSLEDSPRPIIYMILDMQSCTVGGASIAAANLVGMKVSELFPGRPSELLQGFWEEVDRCEDASEVAILTQKQRFFSEWLVQWSPQQADFIDGFVQVVQNADGAHQLLLRCVASARSPLSVSSGISDSGRSTGARPPPPTSVQALSVLPGMPLPDVQPLH